MWIEFSIIVFIVIFYFLCYVEIKINKYDGVSLFDKEITRSKINQETYLKLPFYFNGKHINESYSKKHLVDAITCVIFGIFCTQDEENCGLFEKISYIKCDICKKLSNKVILDDKVICEKCILTQ